MNKISAAVVAATALMAFQANAQTASTAPPTDAKTAPVVAVAPAAENTAMHIVVVHWKIKRGHEQEFLDYWSQKSFVANREGLIGEFLSSVEDQARFPWINMKTAFNADYTSFFNVGLWKDTTAFADQIGKYIDISKPPLAFEAEARERVFVHPERWRIGGTPLALPNLPGVK